MFDLAPLYASSGHASYLNLIIAVLPCIYLLRYIYKADKLEKEKMSLLIRVFIFGIVAIIPTLVFELIFDEVLNGMSITNPILYNFLQAFFVVALVEESCKYFFVKRITWNSREFNCDFDGVVYAVFASLGFAMLENIMYVFQYGFITGIMRAVLSVPGHMMFAVFFGIQYAKAKRASVGRGSGNPKTLMRLGLAGAVITHGLYDFFAFMDWMILFYIFIVIMYVVIFTRLKRLSASDAYFHQSFDPMKTHFNPTKNPLYGDLNQNPEDTE